METFKNVKSKIHTWFDAGAIEGTTAPGIAFFWDPPRNNMKVQLTPRKTRLLCLSVLRSVTNTGSCLTTMT